MKCFDDRMALEWQSDCRILWEEADNSFFTILKVNVHG